MVRVVCAVILLPLSFDATADVALFDEAVPQPNLTERFLAPEGPGIDVHALATMGIDTIEAGANGQSTRSAFLAYGAHSRARVLLGERVKVDVGVTATIYGSESEFLDDSSWSRSESRSEVASDLVGRFRLGDGLSIGGGAHFVYLPESSDSFNFSDLSAEVHSSPAELIASELVLTKVGSAWSAGFAWREKKSASRSVKRSSSDEITEFSEDVALNELISAGVTAKLQNGKEIAVDVRASSSSSDFSNAEKSTSSGSGDPQRRYEIAGLYSLGDSGSQRLSFGVGYRTIGYSTQSNVLPQYIPMWTLLFRDQIKVSGFAARLDALLGYGEDMQSLPDFNANYRRILFSLQAGVQL